MKTKKLLITLLFVLSFFALALGFVACEPIESSTGSGNPNDSTNDPSEYPVILSAPENLQIDFWKLTWDKVENAVSYTVGVTETGVDFETEATSYNLSEYMDAGTTYTVYVIANGDGKDYLNSDYTEIEYTTEEATSSLVYNLLEDGTLQVKQTINTVGATRIVIPDTYAGKRVTQIADCGFAKLSRLTQIRLPSGLKILNTGSFEYSGITEINFPSSLEEIGSSAFSSCSNLRDFTIPDNIKQIGGGAFSDCVSLTEIKIPKSITHIENSTFTRCTGLKDIEIPESVTYIGGRAFNDTAWYENQEDGFIYINSVLYKYKGTMPENTVIDNLPSFVQSISGYAFEKCVGLTKIVIPEGWTSLEGSTFWGCSDLKEVVLPKSLKSIGGAAFSHCTSLKNIELPEGLISIGSSAFASSGLTDIKIPDSVIELGNSLFQGCSELTNIVLPEGISSIPNIMFQGCKLTEFVIPKSVTSIGLWAFSNCANLISIVIPESVTNIGMGAFVRCENLAEIYFCGTEEQWRNIEFEDDCADPTYYGATLYYYSETQPEEDGNYWHYDVDGVTPVIW